MDLKKLGLFCESLYRCYNKRIYVSPDPLQFLYSYENLKDREIVALIASSLAYGRVNLILKNVGFILENIPNPYNFITDGDLDSLKTSLSGFKHRFTDGNNIWRLCLGLRNVLKKYGSLEGCLAFHLKENDFFSALSLFINEIQGNYEKSFLLADPKNGSACKRLFLFLRWMVRKDDVDCGGWNCLLPKELIVPLDTHLFRISKELGFTQRKQADMKTSIEITENFKKLCPEDPVKYDFVLTRFGIRKEDEFKVDINALCESCSENQIVTNQNVI